ncbi:MAG TPA: bifunctional riboflavin kinase/FAD synthetase [Gemmatimonadaceae bacterium]|nr:bifunctional riboflavin kinase/FAD synthetase [Gemmatimonadaceae bacterium]
MPSKFRGWEDSGLPPDSPGTVCTVGTFDGVHRGHQSVLARIAQRAEASRLHSVLVTFDPHPLEVVRPEHAPPLLTIGSEKLEIVAQSGINYMAIVPFTEALRRFSAAQFVDEVLLRRFHVRELVIGYDHHFGRGREGSAEVMRELGERRGFRVEVVGPVTADTDAPVSSSRIRRAIAAGALDEAGGMLGRPYSVSGTVRQGDRRGRLLGFPTVNLGTPPDRKLLPPTGVYAVRVQSSAGTFGGMMNLGGRPTFGDPQVSLEVHLFDADVDLYDRYVTVEFVRFLRDTRRFDGPEALLAQLTRDAEAARAALTPHDEISNLQVSP